MQRGIPLVVANNEVCRKSDKKLDKTVHMTVSVDMIALLKEVLFDLIRCMEEFVDKAAMTNFVAGDIVVIIVDKFANNGSIASVAFGELTRCSKDGASNVSHEIVMCILIS